MPKRPADALRPLDIVPHPVVHPEGSALISCGDTQVLCCVTVEEKESLPRWLAGKGRGWVTAEYDMLPRATHSRSGRDSHRGKIGGRTQEIGRLIGRALRAAVDLTALGERLITVDCDVLQADGGTRTAAITGGMVALELALLHLESQQKLPRGAARRGPVAAVSVGMLDAGPQLDLDYAMDAAAAVDLNVVMRGDGELVEVQGTGERRAYSRRELDAMLDLACGALPQLLAAQRAAAAVPFEARRSLGGLPTGAAG